MKIEIETYSDSNECETCGGGWTEGGSVFIDGKEVLVRKPLAACYDNALFSEADLLVMALTKMGHEVLVDGERYRINSHDDEYHGCTLEER